MGKTITHSLLRGQLSRLLLLVVLAVFGTVGAKAVDKADMTKIELGVTYTVPGWTSSSYFYYEATETGKLTLEGTKCPRYYTDNTFTKEGECSHNTVYTKVVVDVEAGNTYYFKGSFEIDTKTFSASFQSSAAGAVGLLSVSPESGSTLDITSETKSNIYVNFDKDIDKGSVSIKFSANGKTEEGEDNANNSSDARLIIASKTIVYNWLQDGTLKEGDEITVTISNIVSADNDENKYGEDGTLTLTYKAPKAPIGLNTEASTIPATFKSYWSSGNEAGIMKLVFTGKVGNKPSATLMFGNKDKDGSGGYYQETLPVKVSGNTVTVDFTGVKRTQETMLPNYTSETFTNISVKVGGVKDEDGNFAYSTTQGSVGSFSFNWTLEVVSNELTYEFTPNDGKTIDGEENLEFWASTNDLTFTGVQYDYINSKNKAATATVELANIQTEDAGDAGVTYTIPNPDDIKNSKALNVKVSLLGIASKAGNEYEPIEANFNVFKVAIDSITGVSEGALIDTIHATDSIYIQMTPELASHIGVIYYYIHNVTTGEQVKKGYIRPSINVGKDLGNGLWANDFGVDYTLLNDNQYAFSAAAYCADGSLKTKVPFASDSVFVYGNSKVYQYSDYKLVSITPDPDKTILKNASEAVFTVEFDGAVAVNDDSYTFINTGSGTSASFDYIKPLDGDASAKYAKKWEISAAKWLKSNGKGAPLQISIAAEDEKGRRVLGNSGLEATSYFDYSYTCTVGVPALTFEPASGSEVDSITTLTVGCSVGINDNYQVKKADIVLRDADNNEVAHVTDIVPVIPAEQESNMDYQPVAVTLPLSTTVKTPGTYSIIFPAGTFILGSQMETVNSAEDTLTLTVKAKAGEIVYDLKPSAITPDTADVQEYLSNITIEFDEEVYLLPDEMQTDETGTITFVNKQTREVISGYAYAMGTMIGVMPSESIDANSDAYAYWTLNIPQGLIFNAAGSEAGFTAGHANPALVFNYTVGIEKEESNVTADPADGTTVAELTKVTLTWPEGSDVAIGNGMISVLDADGNVLGKVDAEMQLDDPDDYWSASHVATIDLSSFTFSNGKYTLSIPEGYFMVDSNESEAMTFSYTIDTTLGINGINAANSGRQTIYTVNGVKVEKTTKGLYIINGKKVVVK